MAEQRAVWEEKTKDIRAELDKLVELVIGKLYKEIFDKFPPQIQDCITTTAADRRTPIQWQMYYKARMQIEHSPEEAAKKLKGADAKRWPS